MEKGVRRRLNTPTQQSSTILQEKLSVLKRKIQKQFPKAQWASDQAYREFDLAVDFREDVSPWAKEEVNRLVNFCHAHKAHAKISSIHVNIWYGDYNKRSGFEYWLRQGAPGCPKPVPQFENWLYIGDSPNDEPMFEAFKYSVGVANLREFLSDLKTCPTWITQDESGKGFRQMAEKLIRLRLQSLKP
jgi:hydroxymethylpyrimidine pyrophosphatase-like HAD family hydrolase